MERNELGQFTGVGVGSNRRQSPISVLLPPDVDKVVRALPNRSEWLRRVIVEAARKELTELTEEQPERSALDAG